VQGFTWYSLTDQIDWQHALREERNDLHPVGLYDLDRRIRPVGRAYQEIIASHQYLLVETTSQGGARAGAMLGSVA
jgi:beta-glucosidase